jgi:hypothetical protein
VIPEEVAAVHAAYLAGHTPERLQTKVAVKTSLAALVERAPGRSVEVRIPPFAAVQAVAGHTHRRGTPAAVVEMDAATWLALACGDLTWQQGVSSGRVHASGERSDLSEWLPLFG